MSATRARHDGMQLLTYMVPGIDGRAHWSLGRFVCVWPAKGAYLFAKMWPVVWFD